MAVSLKSCKNLVKEIYKLLRIFTHFRPDFVSTAEKRKDEEDKTRQEKTREEKASRLIHLKV